MKKIWNRKELCLIWLWTREISEDFIAKLPDELELDQVYLLFKKSFLWGRDKTKYFLNLSEEENRRQEKGEFIFFWEDSYPTKFSLLEDPPLVLSALGNLSLLNRPSIGIVGSRKLRSSVTSWAEVHLTKFFEQYPTPVVSGAAQGVDQLAHRLAIRKSIPTIAVLPCGLSQVYPASFKRMIPGIIEEHGCILTEYPQNFMVKKFSFHQRNRLIAALSNLLLVLQAERKSGSLITANVARRIGIDLAALPGDPSDSVFWGTNDLIAEGAHMLRDRDDLVCMYASALKEGLSSKLF